MRSMLALLAVAAAAAVGAAPAGACTNRYDESFGLPHGQPFLWPRFRACMRPLVPGTPDRLLV